MHKVLVNHLFKHALEKSVVRWTDCPAMTLVVDFWCKATKQTKTNKYYPLMFSFAYAFKGQVHVFEGRVKIVSHSSCRTSAILKYFCPLICCWRFWILFFTFTCECVELWPYDLISGASLVKGIPFNANDQEISGPDIFQKLVPISAHEASSLYSEEKATLLRRTVSEITEKNEELQ